MSKELCLDLELTFQKQLCLKVNIENPFIFCLAANDLDVKNIFFWSSYLLLCDQGSKFYVVMILTLFSFMIIDQFVRISNYSWLNTFQILHITFWVLVVCSENCCWFFFSQCNCLFTVQLLGRGKPNILINWMPYFFFWIEWLDIRGCILNCLGWHFCKLKLEFLINNPSWIL